MKRRTLALFVLLAILASFSIVIACGGDDGFDYADDDDNYDDDDDEQSPLIDSIIGNSEDQDGRIRDGIIVLGQHLDGGFVFIHPINEPNNSVQLPIVFSSNTEIEVNLYTNTWSIEDWYNQGYEEFTVVVEKDNAPPPTEKDIRLLQGEQGPRGPSGPVGPAGPIGATGPQGSRGPSGPEGAGPSGPSGPQGPIGNPGPSGPSGPTGAKGSSGPSGPQGGSGPRGFSGPSGPSGSTGSQGQQGPSGPSGPSGPEQIITKTNIYQRLGESDIQPSGVHIINVSCLDNSDVMLNCHYMAQIGLEEIYPGEYWIEYNDDSGQLSTCHVGFFNPFTYPIRAQVVVYCLDVE